MAPNRVAGGMGQSSASNIFYTGDGPSQVVANYLSSSIGNSSVIQSGSGCANLGTVVTGDISNTVLNSVVSSGPSVGASSLVTDANSALSGGPNLQRSASINNESYTRLPASPMSFSSNNISISGSSIVDGSSVIQPNQDPNSQPSRQHQGTSSATSLPSPGGGQGQFPNASRLPGSLMQDPGYASQLEKKPRLDMKQEDILQKQVLQQYLQRQELAQLQNPNSQLQALIQQQRLRQQQQQQQMLQSMPPIQQQQQQMQLRQQLQQQGGQPASANKRPYDSGVCSRRLMQYLYHQRQRPPDNNIAYWRKFVAEYYSPRAKRRWCLSMYDNVGHHSLGVFPQATMDAWQCDICGSKSGRGFEATFEVLPRLNEIKFGSGIIDELLFLDLPRECRFSSGIMMLEYVKAVQESVYEQLRVVREGQLRIIFAPDLKILSWEFCARRHEELLPHRLVSPQVNQLLQVAQKCQSTIAKSGADGVSQQDLQANSNMVVAAGRQLARSFELQSLNDLGFSKRYVRCLQISEVVNSMKDLMDFCRGSKVGPVEGLKNFPRHASAVKLQPQIKQEMDQLRGGIQHMSNDPNTISKLMAMHPGMGNPLVSNQPMEGRGALSGSAQAALALTNYQNMLSRQSSMNSRGSHQQEPSSPFNHPSPNPSSTSQGTSGGGPGSLQNSVVGGLSGPHVQQQRMALQGNQALQQQMMQHGNQALQQQQMMQQHSQATSGNSSGSGLQQQTHSVGRSLLRDGLVYGGNKTPAGAAASRSSSFKATSHRESSPAGGGTSSFNNQRSVELPQSHGNLHSAADDMVSDFPESAFLGSDLDDSMSFDWKS